MRPEIQIGVRVTLHFALANAAGVEMLSTFDEEPVEVEIGRGELVEGLELALYGLREGDRQTLRVPPHLMYGMRDESLVRRLPAGDFPSGVARGMLISFSDASGEQTAGSVIDLSGDEVVVDFNHPLAGQEVTVRVEILRVAPASRGEE